MVGSELFLSTKGTVVKDGHTSTIEHVIVKQGRGEGYYFIKERVFYTEMVPSRLTARAGHC